MLTLVSSFYILFTNSLPSFQLTDFTMKAGGRDLAPWESGWDREWGVRTGRAGGSGLGLVSM